MVRIKDEKRPQCLCLPLFFFTLFSILRDACEYSSIITFMTFMDEHFSVHRQLFSYFSSAILLPSITHSSQVKLKLASSCAFFFIVHRKQTSFISLYRFDEAIIRYICAAALTRHQSHRIIATNAVLFIVRIQLLHWCYHGIINWTSLYTSMYELSWILFNWYAYSYSLSWALYIFTRRIFISDWVVWFFNNNLNRCEHAKEKFSCCREFFFFRIG